MQWIRIWNAANKYRQLHNVRLTFISGTRRFAALRSGWKKCRTRIKNKIQYTCSLTYKLHLIKYWRKVWLYLLTLVYWVDGIYIYIYKYITTLSSNYLITLYVCLTDTYMHTYTVVYNMFKNTSCVTLFLFGPFNACVNFEELPKKQITL